MTPPPVRNDCEAISRGCGRTRGGVKFVAALLVCVFLSQSVVLADMLRLKSGLTKTGRILAESEGQILFQEMDGVVSEVPASSVSIMDRSDVSGNGGKVSFFTNSPRKKKKTFALTRPQATPPLETSRGPGASDTSAKKDLQEASFDNFDKLLQVWLEKHPETKVWFEKAAEKAVQNSAQLDELAAKARENS